MPKIKFKATKELRAYNGTYSAKDGHVIEVPEAEAKRLMETFPDNFSLVDESVLERKKEPKDSEIYMPAKDRMKRPRKNRKF